MIFSGLSRIHRQVRVWPLALLCLPAATAGAQGVLARAAQRVASLSAEAALSRAVVIDVSAAGGVTVPYGDVQAGVSTVDLVAGSVIRIHLFLRNGSDASVAMPVLPDTAFVLIDASGRRLPRISVRTRDGVRQGALTIPALERIRIDLVFALDRAATTDAALKLGASTIIRGIPLQHGAPAPVSAPVSAPAEATPSTLPPPAPPDSSRAVP